MMTNNKIIFNYSDTDTDTASIYSSTYTYPSTETDVESSKNLYYITQNGAHAFYAGTQATTPWYKVPNGASGFTTKTTIGGLYIDYYNPDNPDARHPGITARIPYNSRHVLPCSWYQARDYAAIRRPISPHSSDHSGFFPFISIKTGSGGDWAIGDYQDILYFSRVTYTNYTNKNNTHTYCYMDTNGSFYSSNAITASTTITSGGNIISGGNIRPSTNNSYSCGTSSYKWSNVYATTFTGALSGNAATVSCSLITSSASYNRAIYFHNAGTGSTTTTVAPQRDNDFYFNPGTAKATCAGWNTSSDQRLKENVIQLDDKIDKFLLSLKPSVFNWKDKPTNKKVFGLIAQEVAEALKENNLNSKDYDLVDDSGDYLGLSYTEFIPMLIHLAQTQNKEIKELKSIVQSLEERLIQLENK